MRSQPGMQGLCVTFKPILEPSPLTLAFNLECRWVYTGSWVSYYRSHNNVGRILYRVATLRNFANDLLHKVIITTLIS